MYQIADFTSQFVYKDLDSDASLLCCPLCGVCWCDIDRCFVCGAAGELLVIPINSPDSLHFPSSHGIKLSPQHIAVHPQLIDTLRNQRYNNEQRPDAG